MPALNITTNHETCRTNVENVGKALYKCYANALCSLGCLLQETNRKSVNNIYVLAPRIIHFLATLLMFEDQIDVAALSQWSLYNTNLSYFVHKISRKHHSLRVD